MAQGGTEREAKNGSPHAEGTLGATPLAHLLVFAHQRGLSGRLTLERAGETVEIQFARGLVRDARTSSPIAYLGNVLYELGHVDGDGLSATLAELATHRRDRAEARSAGPGHVRHGELLLARGLIGEAELAQGLRHQLERKLVHAFTFSDDARFVFRPESEAAREADGVDGDPFALAWAGLRVHGSVSRAHTVLARLGTTMLVLTPGADLDRYGFTLEERGAAMRFADASPLGRSRIEVLVAYVLAITKALGPSARAAASPVRAVGGAPARADRPSDPKRFTTPPMGSVRVPSAAASAQRNLRIINDPKVNFQNAEIALAQHDLELAETLCRRAHEEEPRQAEYLALLAWLRTFRDDGASRAAIDEALEMFERALDLHPGCERAYMYRAQIRKASGDADGALSDFRSAHALNGNNVEAAREIRIHDMRAKKAANERRSSGLFQRILGKK
jgi:tetratricopeptide (TPR) repeat protein